MAKTPKRPRDPNQLAKLIANIATGETVDRPAPVESKAKGGRAGGRQRAEVLSPEERKQIARKAAKGRWGNKT